MWAAVCLLCALLVTYLWITRPKRPPNFPPGPPTLLIFGNLITLIKSSSGSFLTELKALRGRHASDVIGLVSPRGEPIVHVFGAKLIREACSQREFSGRPDLFVARYRTHMQPGGIIFAEGALWQEHRRFALKHLRDLGFGKNSLNEVIADEFSHFAEHLKARAGCEVKANGMFTTSVHNIIWKMVADKRYEFEDPERLHLQNVVEGFTAAVGPQTLLTQMPWTRFVVPDRSGFTALKRYTIDTNVMFSRVIREHRAVLDADNPRDFVDAFLIEMQKTDAAERGFTDNNLTAIGMDFFVAGSETTTTALTWAMLLLCLHSDVQTKMQQELDAVLAGRRPPRYDDRTQLPYTEAVMTEVMRYSSFVPLGPPHHTSMGPAQLAGYTIPQGSIVFMHLHSAHHDRTHWGDPDVFRPARFIGPDGRFRTDEAFMPFNVGKRACLGESLARMELFVFLGCLFQQFRLRLPEGTPPPSMGGPFRILMQPGDYNVIPEPRHPDPL